MKKRSALKELAVVEVTESVGSDRFWDIPPDSPFEQDGRLLEVGAVGTIVDVYPSGETFLVEFVDGDGYTLVIAKLEYSQVRLWGGRKENAVHEFKELDVVELVKDISSDPDMALA